MMCALYENTLLDGAATLTGRCMEVVLAGLQEVCLCCMCNPIRLNELGTQPQVDFVNGRTNPYPCVLRATHTTQSLNTPVLRATRTTQSLNTPVLRATHTTQSLNTPVLRATRTHSIS